MFYYVEPALKSANKLEKNVFVYGRCFYGPITLKCIFFSFIQQVTIVLSTPQIASRQGGEENLSLWSLPGIVREDGLDKYTALHSVLMGKLM
mgnify:CR=1 FL=1